MLDIKFNIKINNKNQIRLKKVNRRVKYHLYRAFRESGMSVAKACQALGYKARYMPFTWLDKLPQHLCEEWLDDSITDAELMGKYQAWIGKQKPTHITLTRS